MNQNISRSKYTVAELFCGCGGFSHGFSGSRRFDVVFGNDIKKAALKTFQINHSCERGTPEVIEQDIRAVSTNEILKALNRRGVKKGELDCLIGGPPCQGFSQMRRSEERRDDEMVKFGGYNQLDQDPRNDLVLRFLEVVNALRPKFILIENVPQMQSHAHNGERGGLLENVKELLKAIGYNSKVSVVNAADYGVPQLRERLIIIASRVCSVSFPEPTHADPDSPRPETSTQWLPWSTVRDAISDLPPPSAVGETLGGGLLALYPNAELSNYARKMRSTVAFPYNHITRRYGDLIIDTIKEMKQGETWDSASARKRREYEPLIADLIERGEDRDIAIEKLARQGAINEKFFNKYYWSAYTRLAWSRPALTITANANFLGSGRFTHPNENRGITMREAARLQSFDDDFKFITSVIKNDDTKTIGVGLDMIGEAVPPLLAENFAHHVAGLLDQQRGRKVEQDSAVKRVSAATEVVRV